MFNSELLGNSCWPNNRPNSDTTNNNLSSNYDSCNFANLAAATQLKNSFNFAGLYDPSNHPHHSFMQASALDLHPQLPVVPVDNHHQLIRQMSYHPFDNVTSTMNVNIQFNSNGVSPMNSQNTSTTPSQYSNSLARHYPNVSAMHHLTNPNTVNHLHSFNLHSQQINPSSSTGSSTSSTSSVTSANNSVGLTDENLYSSHLLPSNGNVNSQSPNASNSSIVSTSTSQAASIYHSIDNYQSKQYYHGTHPMFTIPSPLAKYGSNMNFNSYSYKKDICNDFLPDYEKRSLYLGANKFKPNSSSPVSNINQSECQDNTNNILNGQRTSNGETNDKNTLAASNNLLKPSSNSSSLSNTSCNSSNLVSHLNEKNEFTNSSNHNSEILGSSNSENRLNRCRICGKTYARPSTLKTHMRTHSGEKPYKCDKCDKAFTQAANLTAHLRTHSGEKPFSCEICGRKFSQSSSVTTHMRTHSGERPYACRYCRKAFSDSSTLTKHMRVHSGEKPYQCQLCQLRFSQSGNLNRHMRIHQNQQHQMQTGSPNMDQGNNEMDMHRSSFKRNSLAQLRNDDATNLLLLQQHQLSHSQNFAHIPLLHPRKIECME